MAKKHAKKLAATPAAAAAPGSTAAPAAPAAKPERVPRPPKPGFVPYTAAEAEAAVDRAIRVALDNPGTMPGLEALGRQKELFAILPDGAIRHADGTIQLGKNGKN